MLNSSVDSGPAAPQQQALFDTIYRNQASTTLQSFQLSELRAGVSRTQSPDLVADAFTGTAFIWPALGDVTSHMDYSHPMGIDIALDNALDSPIAAAARGTVSFAGGSDADAYGYYIKIDHGDGLVTLYAHLSEILVSTGQEVAQGDLIGYGGSTGKSTGKHLHFEIRYHEYLADPLSLLPEVVDEPQARPLDCQTGSLTIERGSTTHLEFAKSLPEGTRIVDATIDGLQTGRPRPMAQVVSSSSARVEVMPGLDFAGTGPAEEYNLKLVLEGVTRFEKSCRLQVVALTSSFTPYSEASYVAATNGSPFEEPTPEPVYTETTQTLEPTPVPEEPVETPTEVPTAPTEEPVVIPTGVSLLGERTSPTPAPPTPTETAVPTETVPATETATPAATSTPEPTATPSATVAAGATTPAN